MYTGIWRRRCWNKQIPVQRLHPQLLPLELTSYNFVSVMKGNSEVTNPKNSYNEKEYLDVIKQRCEGEYLSEIFLFFFC